MAHSQPRQGPPDVAPRAPRWPIAAMAASWIIGILWIVMFYMDPTLPVLSELGNWNLLVGFALFLLGGAFLLIFAALAVMTARRRR
ncbi:cell division protein CrgA [Nonomuraea sp. NPDC049480]|uniref:cell division protein CrgA n=1 Tax=Nonomuraea sp. NPDC049480 TaxID=3364353 RepID=UPI0037B6CEAC